MTKLAAWDFKGTERFEVRRRLGEGGMGIVYEAFDHERKQPVALKILLKVSPTAIYRIKQEFRALADVSHPNLVTLHELVSADDDWFFTMELLEGVDFVHYVRPGAELELKTEELSLPTEINIEAMATPSTHTFPPEALGADPTNSDILAAASLGELGELDSAWLPPLNEKRLREALKQLVEGLVALHNAGKLHRDIKPSNVLITEAERVVLLDFGLATNVDEDSLSKSHLDAVCGTVAYMAPEQAVGGNISTASDWYSVGIMLYQALSGRLPFTGTLYKVIFDKQQKDPRPLKEHDTDLPEDLVRLCNHLLERNPSDRPVGREVLARLGGFTPALSTPALAWSAPDLTPKFVGRRAHIDSLRDAFDASQKSGPVLFHVRGTSGVGKTALVRHFLDDLATKNEAVILTGRCYERELVPYKALDSLVDALSRYLRKMSYQAVQQVLPEEVHALARVFPVLNRVEAIHHRSAQGTIPADPAEMRRRAFRAFRELLIGMAKSSPLVLFVDDLQWGDVDSATLLGEVLRPPKPPQLLLLVSYRGEDASANPLLNTLSSSLVDGTLTERTLDVGPLSEEESIALADAILTRDPQDERADAFAVHHDTIPSEHALKERAATIARESAGSPLFIYELACHAPVKRVLKEEMESPSLTLDEVLRHRFEQLPSQARQLLEIVAIAGWPISRSLANEAIGLAPSDDSATTLLTSSHLARTRVAGHEQAIEPYHDRIRHAVLAGISEAVRQERHRALATVLAQRSEQDPEALVLHLTESGQTDLASSAAAAAAERATNALAFGQAASLFGLAFRLGQNNPERWRLRQKQGDALANDGSGARAAEAFLEAALECPEHEVIKLRRCAAEQLLRTGHIERGLAVLREVLSRISITLPETGEEALEALRSTREKLMQRGLRFERRDPQQSLPADVIRADVCWSASVGLTMVNMISAAIFTSKYLHLALDAGDTSRVARGLAMEASFMTSEGRARPRDVARVLSVVNQLADEVGDPYVRAFADLGAGLAALHEGRWLDASRFCDRSESVLSNQCTGVYWEIDTTRTFSIWSAVYRGEIADLPRRLSRYLREARERRNLYATTILRMSANANIVWLAQDDVGGAQQQIEEAVAESSQAGFQLQSFWELCSRLQIDLYTGDGLRAWARAAKHWEDLIESNFMRVQVIKCEALFLRARCALSAATEPAHRPLLSAATSIADQLKAEGRHWTIPLGDLLEAQAHSAKGLESEAHNLLKLAEQGFLDSHMELLAQVAKLRQGEIEGGEAGKNKVDDACRWMEVHGVRNPGRMAQFLAPGPRS